MLSSLCTFLDSLSSLLQLSHTYVQSALRLPGKNPTKLEMWKAALCLKKPAALSLFRNEECFSPIWQSSLKTEQPPSCSEISSSPQSLDMYGRCAVPTGPYIPGAMNTSSPPSSLHFLRGNESPRILLMVEKLCVQLDWDIDTEAPIAHRERCQCKDVVWEVLTDVECIDLSTLERSNI